MRSILDMLIPDERRAELAKQYYKRIENLFSDMDFWESINN